MTALLAAVNDNQNADKRADDLEFIREKAGDIFGYFKAVYEMESNALVNKFALDGGERTAAYSEMDKSRSAAHNAAIGAVNQLNRLCRAYGTDSIFEKTDGSDFSYEKPDRLEVAAHIEGFCVEFFDKRPL